MNLAALIFTAITAAAALWTVRLSYRAIGLARDSANSSRTASEAGERAAAAAQNTAVAAEKTAAEVRLGRERDRLESERRRLCEIAERLEELQALQRIVISSTDPRWISARNLLSPLLAGRENDLPATLSVRQSATPTTARIPDARVEIENAIQHLERDLFVHDLN